MVSDSEYDYDVDMLNDTDWCDSCKFKNNMFNAIRRIADRIDKIEYKLNKTKKLL